MPRLRHITGDPTILMQPLPAEQPASHAVRVAICGRCCSRQRPTCVCGGVRTLASSRATPYVAPASLLSPPVRSVRPVAPVATRRPVSGGRHRRPTTMEPFPSLTKRERAWRRLLLSPFVAWALKPGRRRLGNTSCMPHEEDGADRDSSLPASGDAGRACGPFVSQQSRTCRWRHGARHRRHHRRRDHLRAATASTTPATHAAPRCTTARRRNGPHNRPYMSTTVDSAEPT